MKFINIKTILLIAIIIAFIEYNKTDDEMLLDVMLPPGTKVLAFGDSITHGYGVGKNDNYPSQLSKLLNASVINSGVSGEMSKEGLRRLPGVLEKYKPNILILCHGGNDILRKKSLVEAKENIRKMIQLAKDKNIYVLLVGVPKYEVITLTTAQIYYEIAAEMDVPLEDTALESILGDAGLKVDNVHPNAKGYEILSKKIAELISQTYLP